MSLAVVCFVKVVELPSSIAEVQWLLLGALFGWLKKEPFVGCGHLVFLFDEGVKGVLHGWLCDEGTHV